MNAQSFSGSQSFIDSAPIDAADDRTPVPALTADPAYSEARPFSAPEPVGSSRPLHEFRAFTQSRSLPHQAATRSGVSRGRARCGCRTAGLRPQDTESCQECTESGAPCPADPFSARFGRPLPKGMRSAAAHMDWDEFTAAFRPDDGPLQLQEFAVRRTGAARRTITVTMRIDGRTRTLEAGGVGTISAMTSIVYAAGYPLEINAFHQQRAGNRIATFLECSRGYQRRWAMGMGSNTTESIIDAFIAAANRVSTLD